MMLSPDLARRYSRQTRLADIGPNGQAKLCAAEVSLGGEGFARVVEERYARAAGLRIRTDAVPPPAPIDAHVAALGLRHDASREVAEGALRALVAMIAALGKP